MDIKKAIQQLDWYFNEDDGSAAESITKEAYKTLALAATKTAKGIAKQWDQASVAPVYFFQCHQCGHNFYTKDYGIVLNWYYAQCPICHSNCIAARFGKE